MKKIYIILPDLSAGGAERVAITIARILKKSGFNIEFINLGNPEGDMYDWIVPEFTMTSFGCNRVLTAIPKLYSFMKEHSKAIFFSSREHVNVVGLLCAKIANREMVVRIPNMPKNKLVSGVSGIKASVIKNINKRLLKSGKWVIAQNNEMRKQLIEVYNLQENKVIAINNPVDKEYVLHSAKDTNNPYPKNETIFLNICNIAYSKGIDILLKAWEKVVSQIPNAHLYIAGRNNSEYAQSLVNKAHEDTKITFLGFQSNPYPFLKYCDCFVLPSRMEGFPNVVLEAMCFNRPIACTSCVEVIKDIINPGKNGYYCDIEDSEALAEIMIKAVKLKQIDNSYDLFDKDRLLKLFC